MTIKLELTWLCPFQLFYQKKNPSEEQQSKLSLTRDGLPVHGIQCLVDLVKQVERRRVALLDGEDERHGNQGLLPAGQLLHVPHLGVVAGEGDLDAHARELLHDVTACRRVLGGRPVVLIVLRRGQTTRVLNGFIGIGAYLQSSVTDRLLSLKTLYSTHGHRL